MFLWRKRGQQSIRITEKVAKAETCAKVLKELDGNSVSILSSAQHAAALSSWDPMMNRIKPDQGIHAMYPKVTI